MDNITLVIAVAILNLLFSINVFITSIQRKYNALFFLSGSFLSLMLACVLLLSFGSSQRHISAFFFNVLLIIFYLLYYAGIRHYAGITIWPRRLWLYLGINVIGQGLTSLVFSSYDLRVTLASGLIILIYTDAFFSTISLQARMTRSVRRITRFFLVGYPLYFLVRLVLVIRNNTPEKFLTDQSVESTVTLVFMMLSSGVYAAIATIVENQQILAILKAKNDQALEMVGKLRESDKNKTAFLSILSHELRNPLASISMGLSLLNRQITAGETGSKARDTTEMINRQLSHLTRLVDDLLDITRINQQRIILQKEQVQLSQLLGNIIDGYRCQYSNKGIRLVTDLAADPVILDADPVRLTQVVSNLLHNAFKFTESGGEVVVSMAKDEPARQALITVQDSGIGIDAAYLPTLFEQFMQVDQSLNRGMGGLGLGLAIAKSIIEMHGGEIAVTSDGLGHGTRFTIRIPLLQVNETSLMAETAKAGAVLKALRILVIEDNPDLNAILCDVLQSANHQVEQAINGPAGILIAKSFKPDVIICDIGLPGMSGYDVAKAIRSHHATMDTYLIAFSGYAHAADIERAKAAGFDKHLAKPVDYGRLFKILAEV